MESVHLFQSCIFRTQRATNHRITFPNTQILVLHFLNLRLPEPSIQNIHLTSNYKGCGKLNPIFILHYPYKNGVSLPHPISSLHAKHIHHQSGSLSEPSEFQLNVTDVQNKQLTPHKSVRRQMGLNKLKQPNKMCLNLIH
jgi:hypothetical protein